MRIIYWAPVLVILGMFLSAGCGEPPGPKAKPLSEEERKKIDDEMRKMSEKNKKR